MRRVACPYSTPRPTAVRSIARSALRRPGVFTRLVRREVQPMRAGLPLPGGTTIRPIADADWGGICAYDAAVVRREPGRAAAILAWGPACRPPNGWRIGEIASQASCSGRDGRSAAQIGPLVAERRCRCAGTARTRHPRDREPDLYRSRRHQDRNSSLACRCGFAAQRAADAHAVIAGRQVSTTRRGHSPSWGRSSAEKVAAGPAVQPAPRYRLPAQ